MPPRDYSAFPSWFRPIAWVLDTLVGWVIVLGVWGGILLFLMWLVR